jgi:hypothetical protein
LKIDVCAKLREHLRRWATGDVPEFWVNFGAEVGVGTLELIQNLGNDSSHVFFFKGEKLNNDPLPKMHG